MGIVNKWIIKARRPDVYWSNLYWHEEGWDVGCPLKGTKFFDTEEEAIRMAVMLRIGPDLDPEAVIEVIGKIV